MKHNFFQKWTSLVLAVLMVISLAPTFTLTARAAEAKTYNKVALENIEATDTIIIVSTKGESSYAMSNDKGASSAPTAVPVTVDNDTITTDAANILWNISNENGNLTIYPAGQTDKWLYCTTSNNGVRVGTNANKVFTMDSSGYLKNTATNRYLGVYNNADWRCYTNTTGNTAGQTFSFYKLVENAETEPGCEHINREPIGEAKPATCTEDGITAGEKCADCGKVLAEQTVIPATGHNYVDGECTVCHTQPSTLTILEAIELGNRFENNKFSTDKYYVTGKIKSIAHTTYGNMYIEDEGGNSLYIYGLYSADGSVRYDAMETKPAEGDTIKVLSVVGKYNSNIQLKNAWLIEHTLSGCTHSGTVVIDEAVAATCTKTGLTEGSHCSACGAVIVAQTTTDIIPHNYEDGACTMCGKAEPVLPFKVGDVVIFTGSKTDGTTYELTAFHTNGYGVANVYTGTPAGTFPITVVEGYQSGTFAFRNGDNYITRNSNNIILSETLGDDSSWIVSLDGEELVIKSYSDGSQKLQFNASSPRFKVYTSKQQPIKIVEVTEPVIKSVSLTLNEGVTVKVTMNIPEAWLTANAGAVVKFSNGAEYAAQAGENVYSVDLTPAQINDALTVRIEREGTVVFDAVDVSVTAYREKAIADGYAKDSALIKLIDAALAYSNAADGTGDNLANDFTGVGGATVSHKDEGAKLLTGFYGNLGTYASVYVRVNIDNISEGESFTIKVGNNASYTGTVVGGYIVIDKLYPANFDETISIVANTEGSSATFSFNSYLKAVYEATSDQLVKNFAVATYLYGLAAEEYLAAE